jgi:integrase/recombinase XerD
MKFATRVRAPEPDRHIEAFLEMMSAERGASANTLSAYAHDLSDYARFLRGRKITLPAVGESDIRAYLDVLGKSELSASTALRRRSAIRQLHKFLYAEGFAKTDPSTRVDGARRARPLPKILSEAEVVSLIDAVQRREPKARARIVLILELLYGAGLRVSELVSLRRAAVSGGKDMLRIRGKGGRERIVPLGSKARAALAAYLTETRDEPAAKASPFLFASRGRSGHLTRHRVGQLLKALAREAGFDETRLSPHVLRHAFASHLLAHGADLRSVQSMLGHADIATTEIYTHVQAERLAEAVAAHHPLSRNTAGKKGPRSPRAPRVG